MTRLNKHEHARVVERLAQAPLDLTAQIPPLTLQGIHNHVDHGLPVGHFLTNVLNNDLEGAFAHADSENVKALHAIVKLLVCYCPGAAWGRGYEAEDWRKAIAKLQKEAEANVAKES